MGAEYGYRHGVPSTALASAMATGAVATAAVAVATAEAAAGGGAWTSAMHVAVSMCRWAGCEGMNASMRVVQALSCMLTFHVEESL